MRQVSTLQQDQRFKLDRAEQSQGFLGFYRNKHASKDMRAIDFLWQVYAMLLMPNISGREFSFNNFSKEFRNGAKASLNNSVFPKSTLYRVNAERKFILKTCSISVSDNGLPGAFNELVRAYEASNKVPNLAQILLDNKSVSEYMADKTWDKLYTGEQLAARLNINQRGREILRTAIENVQLERISNRLALVIRFNITFREAEFLNQTPAIEIKNGNFYSFMYEWISQNLGTEPNAEVAPYSVPISKIAAQVKKASEDPEAKVTPRVGEDQIVVTHLGEYLMVPAVDNTKQYEDAMSVFGQRNDGSFSFDQGSIVNDAGELNIQIGPGAQQRAKLPANMPLFTDWVNRKFAYVNSAGRIETLDLGSCTPLSSTHIKGLLDTWVEASDDKNILGYSLFIAEATRPGFSQTFRPTEQEMDTELWKKVKEFVGKSEFLNKLVERVALKLQANGNASDVFEVRNSAAAVPLRAFSDTSSITEFRFIGRMVKEAKTIIQDNLEVIFRKYSVKVVLEALAVLHIFAKYVGQYDIVVTKDRADRQKYIDQGLDENYQPAPLPNFRKDAAYLPHQARAENKLRANPAFAIIEVDAGGGKTMQILSNVLKELRDGSCKRPIIACPSHLVSSYVHEAVYFTEGKINIVPITNVSFKQHGEERLRNLIRMAPLNTIFLTDFDFVKNKTTEVAYGNKMVTIYKNAEFLRSFEFDLICVDECHYLRNKDSLRTRAMASFMTEIPMKRLASGTFIADTIADVASQFALLDPTVFGTREHFSRTYGADARGNKVLAWKPNAEVDIRRKMEQHCVVIKHKRKEWAALLPFPREEFFGVELTENQRALYESILQQTLEKLREAIAKDPELKEALESNDDTKVEEIQQKLRRYLARLEAFLSTPETDEAGKDFLLLPEDRVSPKVRKIYERIRDHTEQQIPGKILIFTNYIKAAESVYNNAPPDIKKRMILYTAANKAECKTMFETMPQKDIMVGVETSMNTGLNLQFVSRLIRMETVWTPGSLEQGNARVNRPNVKKKETRAEIFFDWIVINKTIDVTKISRLISKLVSKTKFDEYDNPAYQAIESLPQIAMTMDTIAEHNDFEGTLLPYLESYQHMKQVQMDDFRAYREQNQGKLEPTPIKAEGLLPGSKLMTRVPYVPDMQVYGEEQLGLVRYDQFVRQDMTAVDDDDDDADADAAEGENDEDDEEDAKKAALAEERAAMRGQPVHTAWGDGVITGLGKKRIRVLFEDGTRKGMNKMAAYVITRSTTNSKDMREALLKQVGDIPLTEPFSVPVEQGPANKKRTKPEAVPVVEEVQTAEFDITIINDFLALAYRSKGSGDTMIDKLSNVGFIKSPDYYYSWVKGPNNLIAIFKAWSKAGFEIDPKVNKTFQHIYQALKGNKSAMKSYGFATQMELRNWYRSTTKPTSNPKELHPYPIVQEGNMYIALPIQGQPGTRAAIKFQPMAIRWQLGGGEDEVLRFVTRAAEIKDVLKQVKDAGIEIGNLDELKEQYDDFKQVKPRE